MNNSVDGNPPLPERFAEVFARLPEQDIEQFYARYQLWLLRRRVPILQKQIETLDEHLAENQRVMQSLQPAAIALAVLARLQASGVSNIELLDQLLSRGENWLDRMMQRLDYCEQVQDFIQGDYTQWCYRSLDGAYDWIDTLLGSVNGYEEPRPAVEEAPEVTEEQLLQRLRQDDEEDVLAAVLTQPVSECADQNQNQAPAPAIQAEGTPPGDVEPSSLAQAPALAEAASEAHPVPEQPPELVDWADLDAPNGRPAPWYGVGLAPDASGESGPQDEMNEWIKVLQEEGGPQTTAVVEDAESLPLIAETGQSLGDEVSLNVPGSEQAETPAVDEAAAGSEPLDVLAGEEASAEIRENVAPAEALDEREDYGGQPAAESTTLSQESACEVIDAMGMGGEDTEPAETAEIPPVNGEISGSDEAGEAGEREAVVAPEVDVDELPDNDIAGPQEEREQRPWYEYLGLDESGEAQDQRAGGEYGEPEAPSQGETGNINQDQEDEQPAGPGPQDDATRPMALKDVQRTRAHTSPGTDATTEIAPPPAVAGVSASIASDGQVHGAALATPEVVLAGRAQQARIPETRREGADEPALTGVPQVVYKPWPQSAALPQKRSFWRRLFGWLRAGR
jgi:hypothetical protein